MLFWPETSWLPFTAKVAWAALPPQARGAEPSRALPRLKDTLPAGVPLPLAITVAIRVVDPAVPMAAGLAVSVVVVWMGLLFGMMLVTSLVVAAGEPPPETVA